MFSGKKTKTVLSKTEIIDTYDEEAVEKITSPIIEEIIRQKEEQMKAVKLTYADDPKMLEAVIRETERYFNEELEKAKNSYNNALNSVNGGRSR